MIHGSQCGPFPGVPFGRLYPRKQGPYSTPIHIGVEADSFYFTGKSQDVLRTELMEARITERALQAGIDAMDVGVRQCDVASAILAAATRGTAEFGGDYPAIVPLMPTGVGTSCPHLTWSDAAFAAATGTTIEIAGVRHHYHAPLTRTVYLGRPPDKMRKAAETVLEGIHAALDAARPGARTRDVHAAWTKTIERHGLSKTSRCGYSIGLGYPPDWGEGTISLRAEDETVLAPNMTIHVMPGIWLDDWGVSISETIRITDDGCESLCNFPRELITK